MQLDRQSAVPLYHQIVEALRYAIATGEFKAGDALPTLQDASARWGVNLHTVRHAYQQLARLELVEAAGKAGTRVRAGVGRSPGDRELARFIMRTVRTARQRYGMTAEELALMLRTGEVTSPKRPRVYAVECSESQCRGMAEELTERWEVEALPLCFHEVRVPPADGTLLATYFHYNDLRRLWPETFERIRFVAIHPDRNISSRLRGARRVLVAESEITMAQNIVADVKRHHRHPVRFEPVLVENAADAFEGANRDPVLFSPRMWDRLSEAAKKDPRAVLLRYYFDSRDLEAAGRDLGWRPSSGRCP